MTTFSYWDTRFRKNWSKIASVLLILIGSTVLVGWVLNIPALKSILPGLATMKVNTALCFVLVGVALRTLTNEQPNTAQMRLAQTCALITLLIGALTLSEYVFGWELGIDQLVFQDTVPPGVNTIPGRMAHATAFSFVLLGLALWLLTRSHSVLIAQLAALVVVGIAFLVIAGYLYGVSSLYEVFAFTTVAFHTALAFLVAGTGILLVRPNLGLMPTITSNAPGGILARRLLPFTILIPLTLGWIRLKGQQQGLYSTEFGIALFVLSNTFIGAVLVWWNARLLNRSDAERKLVDAARRQSEERFGLLVDNIKDYAIYMLDTEGNITSWNVGAEHIKGYQAHEILGRHFSCFYPNEITQSGTLETKLQEAATKGSIEDFGVRIRKDGTEFIGNGTITALRDDDGQLMGFAKITRDMTERERVQASLRESEAKFRVIFERSTLGKSLTAPNGKLLMVNQAFADMLGYTIDEMQEADFVAITYPDDRAQSLEAVRILVANEQTKYQMEKRYIHKNGMVIWTDVSTTLLRDETGTPLYFITSVADITERKRVEKEMQEAQRLQIELEKEKEMLSLKEQFVSIVSHEFRTPLSVILSSAELVDRYRERMTLERQVTHIHEIIVQSNYMRGLLDDILTFNKARAGKMEFQPAPLNLMRFCRDALDRLELTSHGKHTYTFHPEGDLEILALDPKLLQHIVTNLLSNAVKYSPEGGEVRLDVVFTGNEVILRFSDQGIGIPAESQKRLFEPFHRADNVGTISGTGLGLAIVKESVDLHGGTITCESDVTKGTIFTVRLPVAPA
jgi:PAS domain S-box-containing protein